MRRYEWRAKCRTAILETKISAIEKELSEAEDAVVTRIRELFRKTGVDVELERDALDDAMYNLRALRHALEQKTRAALATPVGNCEHGKESNALPLFHGSPQPRSGIMIKNEQAIRAFREILTHIESAEIRADAIFELMLERGQINKQELEGVMDTARARQEAKWAQVRAKVDSLLQEEADKTPARVA